MNKNQNNSQTSLSEVVKQAIDFFYERTKDSQINEPNKILLHIRIYWLW